MRNATRVLTAINLMMLAFILFAVSYSMFLDIVRDHWAQLLPIPVVIVTARRLSVHP